MANDSDQVADRVATAAAEECVRDQQAGRVAPQDQVVVAVRRRVKPGCQGAYEQWISSIIQRASKFEGYLGAQILRPSGNSRTYTTIYRFDTQAHSQAWSSSQEHAEAVAEAANLIEGEAERDVLTGLEVWFDQPDLSLPHKVPTKWKMSLVLFAVVFVLISALNWLLGSWMSAWPIPARTAAVVGIQVLLMTYLVMPRINRWLAHWLYA